MSTDQQEAQAEQPSNERQPELVVGLGASAGGIRALTEFFAHVDPDERLAYVVILHLSPDHESHLAEVLQQKAPFPVTQVREPTRIDPHHVYVISPNLNLQIRDGLLVVQPTRTFEERKAPVDLFFRTLADDYGPRSVAVVLSGTGPNGSNGLKRVKEHGGLTIVQDPAEAEFPDMPNNSIATGLVDYVMRVADIPRRITEYRERLAAMPAEARADPPDGSGDGTSLPHRRSAEDWREILTLLRVRTGQDFSNYKPATIRRRVERRLSVRGLTALPEYAQLMRQHSDEALLLMKDLLISVTNFFRDPQSYEALQQRVLPALFAKRDGSDQIRIWCPGCATGEEAYSLAMLFAEHASTAVDPPAIQVFGTDLDEQAIATAREGLYSEADAADLSPARLARFFHHETGGYRVRRELRETVLFAHHNVIRDPPFSHLDLVSCRNLLIYLNRSIQDRLIETFHFALRPGGFLFLGTSEAADNSTGLFVAIDKSAHIFESRIAAGRPTLPLADRVLPSPPAFARTPEPRPSAERISPGELHLRLLEQYSPPSLVVNEEYALLHVSPGAAPFMHMPAGEPSRDVFKLVHPELRADLRTALHLAGRERRPIVVSGVRVQTATGERIVRVTAKPVLREDAPPRGYFLVVIEDDITAVAEPGSPVQLTSPAAPEARQLSEELAWLKDQLRSTIDQYETHAEEARAANEELQAMNEELRSAAEELETSKEELQSVNEELTTVNQELKIKIDELRLSNNDFQNLIIATDIAAIFLDRSLRVKLSTPRAQGIFNLLPTDIGRKLSDITTRLNYEPLRDDMVQVLESLQAIEREVETKEGRWFLMRILPYRTTDDRIEGLAMTFHDITARHQAEMQLRAGEERLRLLIDSAADYAIFTFSEQGIIDSWNSGAERMFGYAADEIIGARLDILATPEDREAKVPEEEIRMAGEKGRALDERWHLRKDATRFFSSGVTTRLGDGGHAGFAKIARDLTSRRQAELALATVGAEVEDRVSERTEQLQSEVHDRTAAQAEVSQLLRRLVTAQEDQRTRISRDLHDQLGQQLMALRLALERHRASCQGGGVEDLDRAQQLTSTIDAAVDFLAWELRPAILDDLGLAVALSRYLEEWSDHHGVSSRFQGRGTMTGRLAPDVEITFYRVAQEALNNIVKHARASSVDVILESHADEVRLIVEDDGAGFDVAAPDLGDRGIGLAGMRERAALIGATLLVESTPGRGTAMFLTFPVR